MPTPGAGPKFDQPEFRPNMGAQGSGIREQKLGLEESRNSRISNHRPADLGPDSIKLDANSAELSANFDKIGRPLLTNLA